MNRTILLLVITISMAVTSFSCVSGKKYKTLESTSQQFMNERDDLKTDNIRLNMSNTELEAELSRIKNQIIDAQDQYDIVASERDKALEDLARLNSKYNDLQTAQEDLIKGNVRETQKLLGELQDAQKSLQEKEDLLRQLEENLDLKKASLDELTFELEKRNERLLELEKVIDAQKRIAEDLKNKVSEALLGFENDGLTVSMKDGKVYVSLDEQLLFRSGSWEIDQKGKSALQNLAGVLERNPDIQISIEGHTDDVPYRGSGQLVDNWDLSVKRATTVVRVLLSGSNIDPKRLTASGRSEYVPIDPANTTTARQKNRRTEVVLTPDLSSLYDIINSY